jgi:hypothetical protein
VSGKNIELYFLHAANIHHSLGKGIAENLERFGEFLPLLLRSSTQFVPALAHFLSDGTFRTFLSFFESIETGVEQWGTDLRCLHQKSEQESRHDDEQD